MGYLLSLVHYGRTPRLRHPAPSRPNSWSSSEVLGMVLDSMNTTEFGRIRGGNQQEKIKKINETERTRDFLQISSVVN